MARNPSQATTVDADPLLRGDLRDISLPSLLQLAQAEAITGWIRITGRGEIALIKGQVGQVACGTLSGVEALRELAFPVDGRFTLARGEPGGVRCADNITFALMDAYRLRDEWNRLAGVVLRPVADRPWKPTGGGLDEVVLDLDGRRSLAEILRGRPRCVTLLLDALLDAINLGLIERVIGPRTTAPAPTLTLVEPAVETSEDFDDLVERGRALARQGELVAAEAALQRALAQRPDDRVVQQNLRALARRRDNA